MIKPALALAAFALAGCASLDSVDADVSSYSRWPADRGATTYAFERLPSQQVQPQAAQTARGCRPARRRGRRLQACRRRPRYRM